MAAFRHLYEEKIKDDPLGLEVLKMLEKKNLELLSKTNKDQALVSGVYGELKNKDK